MTQDADKCDLLLLQDSVKVKDERELLQPAEGHATGSCCGKAAAPSDRDERFRLYQRLD